MPGFILLDVSGCAILRNRGRARRGWASNAWWALYAPADFYVHVVLKSVHPAVDDDPSAERVFVASCLFVLASLAAGRPDRRYRCVHGVVPVVST
ncbi:hypothetical protein [Amycolatopsis decaplanina]|uniref:hypothetical protein n=1 Tax=Amycolatopsis decaplanina TaxID=208441 RepID=UPI001376A0F3|nr:hypothetical protein [Amycolatopsis decaplanina]